jgi:PAS domain S-box-containing protein
LYEEAQKELRERKAVEEDLLLSEERFRKVFNNSNIAVSIVTLEEGIFLEANDAFWKLSGLSPASALGHSAVELNMWEHLEERNIFVNNLLEKGSLEDVEVEFRNESQKKTSIAYYELITIKNQLCILCMFYDISEQRQTQRELEESEERFRKVFQSSPVAICITTLGDGRFLEANEAYWNLTGYDPQLFLGKSALELDIWTNTDERREFSNTLQQKRRILNPDYMIKNRVTGEVHYAIALAELIELKGQPCILSMLYDITEQKHIEQALKSAETRTSAIIASIPDMIFEVSKDGTFLDFMASAELNPIMEAHEFIGKKLQLMLPEKIAEQTMFALERALLTQQIHAFEYGLPPGEEIQFFEARVAPVTSESAIIMVRDISQRRWVETEREKLINELEAKNAESEALRESMAIIVETLDESKTVSLILEQLEKVIPYDSASVQLLKNDMLEVVSTSKFENPSIHVGVRFKVDENEPSYPLFAESASHILIRNSLPSSTPEVDPFHKDIRSWLAVPLKVKGTIIGIIALDGHHDDQFSQKDINLALTYANQVAIALEKARLFSEVQNELAERKRLNQELEGKNAELERFTYTVSHDLKSPIITIRGFLGFLERDALSGNMPRLQSDIKRISDATEKMQTLLNDLLELSRIGRLINQSAMTSFNQIVSEALEMVQGQMQSAHIQVQVQEGMASVYVDHPRIVEAMQNLLDNAAKFTTDDPRIEVGQQGMEDGMPVFFVRDHGIGIAADHHERIFGLFNKLDANSDGTGIGLAIVKRIIEVHKGRIWVESEPKKGSTFFFTLPSDPNPES